MPSSPTNTVTSTRDKILVVSTRLFQARGFSEPGMRQIADCLEMRASSLYNHFPSKETLIQQVLERYRIDQFEQLEIIGKRATVAQRLEGYADLFLQMLRDGNRPCLYLSMVREPNLQDPANAHEVALFLKQNVEWIEAALSESVSGKKAESRMKAELIFASMEGLMAISVNEQDPVSAFRRRSRHFLSTL